MATVMLENGADIRFIQPMLEHSRPSCTQIYTQVSIRMLKQVHAATHPAQLPKPKPLSQEEARSGDLSKEELLQSRPGSGRRKLGERMTL